MTQPGRPGELHPAVASEGEYRQQDPRAAAAHGGGQRSHRPGGHHDVDPQALPQVTGHHRLHRVPRSRPLADDRLRLARGRAVNAGLAQPAVTLTDTLRAEALPRGASRDLIVKVAEEYGRDLA